MNYIILAAGVGKRLRPFTKIYPKCLINIGHNETVIQRMLRLINEFDTEANVNIVTGFEHDKIEKNVPACNFIYNPFFEITNSVASLWFARDLLEDEVVIINGDVVIQKDIMEKIVSLKQLPAVFLDSSVKNGGDYNVQIHGDCVAVMSKEIIDYFGEYVGITKHDKKSAILLKEEIDKFIQMGSYENWYENALVQMILDFDFKLFYLDVADYEWTEVDSINDVLLARKIQKRNFDSI